MVPHIQLYLLPCSSETLVLPSPQNTPPISVSDGKGNCSAEGTGMRPKAKPLLRLSTNLLPYLHSYFPRHQCCHFQSLWGPQCISWVVFWFFSTASSGFSFSESSGSMITQPSVFQLINSCCYCVLSHSLHPLSVSLFKIPLLSFKWSFRKELRLMPGIQPAIIQMPSGF